MTLLEKLPLLMFYSDLTQEDEMIAWTTLLLTDHRWDELSIVHNYCLLYVLASPCVSFSAEWTLLAHMQTGVNEGWTGRWRRAKEKKEPKEKCSVFSDVQWSSYWECRLSVMIEAALGFTFSGKGGHKMVHKSLVPSIKRTRKLLPVRIFFFLSAIRLWPI